MYECVNNKYVICFDKKGVEKYKIMKMCMEWPSVAGFDTDQFVLSDECFSISIDIFEKQDRYTVTPVYKS